MNTLHRLGHALGYAVGRGSTEPVEATSADVRGSASLLRAGHR